MDSIDCRPPDGVNFKQTRLVNFVDLIQRKLEPLLPGTGKTKDTWSQAYRAFHQFLVSDTYKRELCILFQPSLVTPACSRFATRLAFQINEI